MPINIVPSVVGPSREVCSMKLWNFTFRLFTFRSITKVMRVVEDPADFLKNPRRFLSDYTLTISTARQLLPNNSLVFITAHPPAEFSGSGSGSGSNDVGSGSIPGAATGPESDSESIVGSGEGVVIPTPPLNQTEPIYSTSYYRADIPTDLLQHWSYASVQSVMGLSLPGPNMFVPSSLELLPSSNQTSPQQLTSDPTDSDTWFLQDTEDFPQPRATFRCEIRPSFVEKSANWAGMKKHIFRLFCVKFMQQNYINVHKLESGLETSQTL